MCRKVHLLDKRCPWCSADHGTWTCASNVPQTSGREAVDKKTKQKKLLADLQGVKNSIQTVVGEQKPALVAEAPLS